jgi:uncharacterized membrane protein (UPF0127 family)
MHRRWFVRAPLSAALCLALPARAQSPHPHEPLDPSKAQALPLTPLDILSGGKAIHFEVEVARTEREHATGLMHRTSLAADRGMLFLFKPPRNINFWMRNTFIPLDMIFTNAKGTITFIAENVQPHVETGVGPGRPSGAVLEVIAGTAARLGLKPGDHLRHAAFDGAE